MNEQHQQTSLAHHDQLRAEQFQKLCSCHPPRHMLLPAISHAFSELVHVHGHGGSVANSVKSWMATM